MGRASWRLAGTAAAVAATGSAALWLTGGCSAGEAVALYACSLVVGAMVLHIADHVADFRGQ